MLNQLPQHDRAKINFGVSRRIQNDESVFVSNTYSSVSNLIDESSHTSGKLQDIGMIPITEIRAME